MIYGYTNIKFILLMLEDKEFKVISNAKQSILKFDVY